jgi:Holliday junction resolvase
MSHPSKIKGNRVEREVVDIFKQEDIKATRAWGSNGKSLGHHEEVDVYVDDLDLKIQVKARKQIAEYVIPDTDIVDMQVVKGNNKPHLAVLPLKDLVRNYKKTQDMVKLIMKLQTDLEYERAKYHEG